MDRRGFLRRAPAAVIAAASAPALAAKVAQAAPEPAEELGQFIDSIKLVEVPVDRVVDRKVVDVTFQTVIMPDPKRRKRRTKEELAEAQRMVDAQKQYARIAAASPEEIARVARAVQQESVSLPAAPSYSLIRYDLQPRQRQ